MFRKIGKNKVKCAIEWSYNIELWNRKESEADMSLWAVLLENWGSGFLNHPKTGVIRLSYKRNRTLENLIYKDSGKRSEVFIIWNRKAFTEVIGAKNMNKEVIERGFEGKDCFLSERWSNLCNKITPVR